MLKKTITFENPFTNNTVTEEHYFHISKADLVEMEMEENATTYTGPDGETRTGMSAKIQNIVDSNDGKAILAELKDIIRRAYGKKDGDRFLKSKALWEEFEGSEAYSQLIFELCTDADAAADFMNGVVPANLDQVAAEIQAKATQTQANSPTIAAVAASSQEPRLLTQAEVAEMDSDELKSGIASGKYKLS